METFCDTDKPPTLHSSAVAGIFDLVEIHLLTNPQMFPGLSLRLSVQVQIK